MLDYVYTLLECYRKVVNEVFTIKIFFIRKFKVGTIYRCYFELNKFIIYINNEIFNLRMFFSSSVTTPSAGGVTKPTSIVCSSLGL